MENSEILRTPDDQTQAKEAPGRHDPALLPCFAVTIFASACLLFWIQPLFSKMILPHVGGAPAVWTVAMLFFQALLLCGYLYAHLIVRVLAPKHQIVLHLGVCVGALFFLPVAVSGEFGRVPGDGSVSFWLLGLFVASLGLPFFALSANAPLLQHWFAATRHHQAHDPYFLYGASNVGSLAVVFAFPFLLEPAFGLKTQSLAWSAGFATLTVFIAVCGFMLLRNVRVGSGPTIVSAPASPDGPPTSRRALLLQRGWWTLLAFVPSSLLLGVTTQITRDFPATPLFWMVPLGLYLFSFVLVFSRGTASRFGWAVVLQPFTLVAALALAAGAPLFSGWPGIVGIGVHVANFFVCALVCHGTLAGDRPAASRLTEFYFFMSLGGVCGGIFNALVAPAVFHDLYEYPLVLLLAALLGPTWKSLFGISRLHISIAYVPAGLLVVLGALAAALAYVPMETWAIRWAGVASLVMVVAGIAMVFANRVAFGASLAAALIVYSVATHDSDILHRSRSFFGTFQIKRIIDGQVLQLSHGSTIHGWQTTDPRTYRLTTSYYHLDGPLGQLFVALRKTKSHRHVASVGLGVGTSVCYKLPGQTWDLFEIDPHVVALARDARWFHYLEKCGDNAKIILGDARLSLLDAPDDHYDLIILDAFSSDAIPMHLLTREAFRLYLRKLDENGLIAIHISNRHVSLEGQIANQAAALGLIAIVQSHAPTEKNSTEFPSQWMVLGREIGDFPFDETEDRWNKARTDPDVDIWTDDYSNLLQVLN